MTVTENFLAITGITVYSAMFYILIRKATKDERQNKNNRRSVQQKFKNANTTKAVLVTSSQVVRRGYFSEN